MTWTLSGLGLNPSGVYRMPKKLDFFVLITHFSSLSLMPAFLVRSMVSRRCKSCSLSFFPQKVMSSAMPMAPSQSRYRQSSIGIYSDSFIHQKAS